MMRIFLSHASEDKVLADSIYRLLNGASKDVKLYYSGNVASNTPPGKDYQLHIRQEIKESDCIIIIESSSYYSSTECIIELGAIWALEKKFFFMTMPSFQSQVKETIFNKPQRVSLDDSIAINKLAKEIGIRLNDEDSWEEQRISFIKEVNEYENKSRSKIGIGSSKFRNQRLIQSRIFYSRSNPVGDDFEAIKEALTKGTVLPTATYYSTIFGARTWLTLSDPRGSHKVQGDALAFWEEKSTEVLREIQKNSRAPSIHPDLISLGSGDGIKDMELLMKFDDVWTNIEEPISYVAVDISPRLIHAAYELFLQRTAPPVPKGRREFVKNLEFLGMVSDFYDLDNIIEENDPNSERYNVFLLLGNTLGNVPNEEELIGKIHSAMKAEDFLVLEIRKRPEDVKDIHAGGSDIERKKFYFQPLGSYFSFHEVLNSRGVQLVKRHDGEHSHDKGLSKVPETLSFRWAFEMSPKHVQDVEEKISIEPVNEINLSVMHHYDADKFQRFLNKCRFKLIKKFEIGSKSAGVLVYLLRKL